MDTNAVASGRRLFLVIGSAAVAWSAIVLVVSFVSHEVLFWTVDRPDSGLLLHRWLAVPGHRAWNAAGEAIVIIGAVGISVAMGAILSRTLRPFQAGLAGVGGPILLGSLRFAFAANRSEGWIRALVAFAIVGFVNGAVTWIASSRCRRTQSKPSLPGTHAESPRQP